MAYGCNLLVWSSRWETILRILFCWFLDSDLNCLREGLWVGHAYVNWLLLSSLCHSEAMLESSIIYRVSCGELCLWIKVLFVCCDLSPARFRLETPPKCMLYCILMCGTEAKSLDVLEDCEDKSAFSAPSSQLVSFVSFIMFSGLKQSRLYIVGSGSGSISYYVWSQLNSRKFYRLPFKD